MTYGEFMKRRWADEKAMFADPVKIGRHFAWGDSKQRRGCTPAEARQACDIAERLVRLAMASSEDGSAVHVYAFPAGVPAPVTYHPAVVVALMRILADRPSSRNPRKNSGLN
jgi:hypothetical protein